jgi:hypothetical protein
MVAFHLVAIVSGLAFLATGSDALTVQCRDSRSTTGGYTSTITISDNNGKSYTCGAEGKPSAKVPGACASFSNTAAARIGGSGYCDKARFWIENNQLQLYAGGYGSGNFWRQSCGKGVRFSWALELIRADQSTVGLQLTFRYDLFLYLQWEQLRLLCQGLGHWCLQGMLIRLVLHSNTATGGYDQIGACDYHIVRLITERKVHRVIPANLLVTIITEHSCQDFHKYKDS